MRCQDQGPGRKEIGEPERRAPGRPRNADVERRILEVTLRLLEEEGFSRMSIDSIAEAAGVSKPTIYRRWTSKVDIATAALAQLRVSEPPVTSGSSRTELKGLLLNFRESLLRPNGMALIGTVLAEEGHTPELLRLFRERVVAPRRVLLTGALARAREKGELDSAADLDALVNMMIGSFYARYLSGEPIPRAWVDRIADAVFPPGGQLTSAIS